MKISCLVLALVGLLARPSFASSAADTREIVLLSEIQRHQVLSEMRTLLDSTQGILAAIVAVDMPAVARQAKALGTQMPHNVEKHMHGTLPHEFMRLGRKLHKAFDVIAADAERLADPKHSLRQVSDALAQCSGCHTRFQIRTASDAVLPDNAGAQHHQH